MEKVDHLLEKLVQKGNTPSVQYAHFTADKIIHSYAGGLADVATRTPISEHHTLSVYSITKTFTALAILQLQQQGLLKPEDEVKRYLPQFPYPGNISIHHLLTHSSGIPNPLPLAWIHSLKEHAGFNARQFFQAIFEKHNRLQFQPGLKFLYSNLGYVLLGQLIETVSHVPYEQYITENIIARLPLPALQMGFTLNSASHARGYQKQFSLLNALLGWMLDKDTYMGPPENGWKPFLPNYVNGSAYGGLITNRTGLVAYLQQLLQNGGTLLHPESCTRLFTENKLTGGKPSGMCYSWFTAQLNGHRYYTHAGGGGGYYCEVRLYPQINRGSVLMLNRTGISDTRLLNRFDPLLLPTAG